MRAAIALLPLLIVTACATPREACIGRASGQLRVLENLISQTQGNLQRGFAVEEEQDVRVLRRTCRGRNSDGSTFRFPCDRTQTVERNVPVAVDLNAERAKLESLLQRRAQMQANTASAVQQCQAQFPE